MYSYTRQQLTGKTIHQNNPRLYERMEELQTKLSLVVGGDVHGAQRKICCERGGARVAGGVAPSPFAVWRRHSVAHNHGSTSVNSSVLAMPAVPCSSALAWSIPSLGVKDCGTACGKQAVQYAVKQPDEGSVVTRRDTTALENEEHSSGRTQRKSMRLKEISATKQAGGKGETEKGKQPAAQKKRARTKPRHSPFVDTLHSLVSDICLTDGNS